MNTSKKFKYVKFGNTQTKYDFIRKIYFCNLEFSILFYENSQDFKFLLCNERNISINIAPRS